MTYPAVLLVSLALGIDAFSVAIGIGLAGIRRREIYIVSIVVCIFHVFMPLLGLSLGAYLGRVAGPIAATVGALVLITIGVHTIWENLKETGILASKDKGGGNKVSEIINISNPISLAVLAASVSLDALTAGIGLGTLRVDLTLTVITMGIVAGLMTAAGLVFGKRLNKSFGSKAEIFGGAILVLIGLKFLIW